MERSSLEKALEDIDGSVFFEKAQAERPADAVTVDCSRLDYISSAGLRVLLIMHKACAGGVTLCGANEVVTEILSQTGFDSILNIVEDH